MVTPEMILKRVRPYKGLKRVIVDNQSTDDIINAMVKYYYQHESDYNNIAPYFVSSKGKYYTIQNIYDFIINNIDYIVEDSNAQYIKSPAAIIVTGQTRGSDCKNYSLFAAGVLGALNRIGYYIPFCFRFASYSKKDKTPKHVFVVCYPDTVNEIWLDCVPPNTKLNDRIKKPTFYKDVFLNNNLNFNEMNYNGNGQMIGASLTDFVNLGSQIVTGNWGGAITNVLNTLNLGGHSDWYNADLALSKGDTNTWITLMKKFYQRGGVNDADFSGGINGDIFSQYKGRNVPRYTLLPSVYGQTQNADVLQMLQASINAGVLPSSALPTTVQVKQPVQVNQQAPVNQIQVPSVVSPQNYPNASSSYAANVKTYADGSGKATPNEQKDNTILYLVIGGAALYLLSKHN